MTPPRRPLTDLAYFPGCSLASTARENNASLVQLFRHLGYHLVELEDWNCCGSSSAHSIDRRLAFDLASRNFTLVPEGRPLLAACPSCLLRLRHAHLILKTEADARAHYEHSWGRPFDPSLEIVHFFEILNQKALLAELKSHAGGLKGLRFVPYYGCMLARPPVMRHEKNYHGLMEHLLSALGAAPRTWSEGNRCCGTFLSVARPDIVTPMVNRIVTAALESKADCIVTACAMCHMNLEARCDLKRPIPVFHFSELLAVALGIAETEHKGWFARHLVDPRPLLNRLRLLAG